MELYLQMGHGMQKMSGDLIQHWGKGTAILSPVNTAPNKTTVLSRQYRNHGGEVLFDPQLYYPKDGADKLKLYDYWPDAGVSISDSSMHQRICRDILVINEQISSKAIIIPGVEMDIDGFEYGLTWIGDSAHYFRDHTAKPLLATVCLYTEVLRSQNAIETLVEMLSAVDVDGYYIVARSSNEEYIISDAKWMMGLAKLLTCLKLQRRMVIYAYSNHQGLIAALSHVDAIASGNYMNTRQFVPGRFRSKKEDLELRKSNWYFHPYAMTEYKADLLDIAYNRGFIETFRPLGDFSNPYSEMLFRGIEPSLTNYNETNAFMHYLHCLSVLCTSVSLNSFDATMDHFHFLLDNAENLMKQYKAKGLRSQNRDFGAGIEALRIASAMIEEDYGFRLRIDWPNL